MWKNEDYAGAYPSRHKLLRNVPGLGITACVPDELHVKHLGVDAGYVGGVMAILVDTIDPHDRDASLTLLWDRIQRKHANGGPRSILPGLYNPDNLLVRSRPRRAPTPDNLFRTSRAFDPRASGTGLLVSRV